ncbi:hypothetical protein PCASD_22745 [Puccinia coronata f. sp. avenae]|uniref:Uncharacterized protein n=1 Tax=Puccinia coronata f. sp. avenae TaxID=200324 RepID=A0A2N5T0D4_9BASI|nr:hypothetical protein PCASD_22745 [Puccinia coronata f. sp. avenae]
MVSAEANSLSWQTVSPDRRSQLADCQPRPTVSAGRLSAKTNVLSWQTVNQDRRSQLADCQPRPTVSAGRLLAKTNGLSWQTVSQDQRSCEKSNGDSSIALPDVASAHVRVPEQVPQLGVNCN